MSSFGSATSTLVHENSSKSLFLDI